MNWKNRRLWIKILGISLILTIIIEGSLFVFISKQPIVCTQSIPPTCSDPSQEALNFLLVSTAPVFLLIVFSILAILWIWEKLLKHKKVEEVLGDTFIKNLSSMRILPIIILLGLVAYFFGINIKVPAVPPTHPYPVSELNPLLWGPLSWAIKGSFNKNLLNSSGILFWVTSIGYWYFISVFALSLYDLFRK